MNDLALVRLLQLASPALPVGAYCYSQGLEWAVASGRIKDEASAGRWIDDLLANSVGAFEAPLVAAQLRCWQAGEVAEALRLDADFRASRESAELLAETLQMGYSLKRLLKDLADPALSALAAALEGRAELAFPTVWAGFAAAWKIDAKTALAGYLWAWCENQVIAALKAVPLGQAAGQRLLAGLGGRIAGLADAAITLPEDAWCNFTPSLAICSARHETQYSRLFRS